MYRIVPRGKGRWLGRLVAGKCVHACAASDGGFSMWLSGCVT